jgi:maltose alpha-D-glucosyltransferase/alpha-amylase
MERIIRMRKEVPEIGWGDFSFVSTGTPQVLAVRYHWRNNSVLCVHNLSAEPREVRLKLRADDEADCELINLLSDEHSHPEKGVHCVLLEPYGYRWYRVCGLDYLLKRSAI